jgi:hypothetical protein
VIAASEDIRELYDSLDRDLAYGIRPRWRHGAQTNELGPHDDFGRRLARAVPSIRFRTARR